MYIPAWSSTLPYLTYPTYSLCMSPHEHVFIVSARLTHHKAF